jgi:hypothetical protein
MTEMSTYRVSSLHIDGTGSGELADETLGRSHAADDATRCHTLHDILGIPGNQVAVIHNVFLAIDKLQT